MLVFFSFVALIFAGLTFGVFLANARIYQPARLTPAIKRPSVSVLIPARNEEDKITIVLESALASERVNLDVIVLDDNSTDRTADRVAVVAERDDRVRLITGQSLPAGWCGKQFACWQLANAAEHELLLFLDADVTLKPDAIVRAAVELKRRELSLLSGVPFQELSGFSDGLLIPLIHFLLLGYLPMWIDPQRTEASLASGCGQFFLSTREAYIRIGGHEQIKSSMHDGLTLPIAYRSRGESTDVIDLTDMVSCRMYPNARDVWSGLSKNAIEGIAAPRRIGPFTALLAFGHVLPFVLFVLAMVHEQSLASTLAGVAITLSLMVRLYAASRFRQPLWSALIHPFGVTALLGVQWAAFVRHLAGHRPTWKGRGVIVEASEPKAVSSESV